MSGPNQDDAMLLAASVDSLLSDPKVRRKIIEAFAEWIEMRAAAGALGFDAAGEGGRYAIAKLAPWHDLVAEEDGHGPWQVYEQVDRALVAMLRRIRAMWQDGRGRP